MVENRSPPSRQKSLRSDSKSRLTCLAPQVRGRGAAARGGLYRRPVCELRTRVVVAYVRARRGGLDQGFRAGGDLGDGWRRTADNGCRHARRVLRAVRHDHIRGVVDLKGRTVGVPPRFGTPRQLVSIMASYVGVDQMRISTGSGIRRPSRWTFSSTGRSMRSSPARRTQESAQGHRPFAREQCNRPSLVAVLLLHADDPHGICSQVSCGDQARMRAMLKSADLCATEPERAAQLIVDRGFTPRAMIMRCRH